MNSESQQITISDGRRSIGSRELITMLAMLMSGVALAIDIMLPAFADIRAEFGLAEDSTTVAGLVTMFLLGLAVSQVIFGVLSDRFGRKPVLYVGMAIYVVGAAASALAPGLGWLLAARFVWGIGAAAPRMTTLSVLRDTYSGDRMARVLSFVMAIFILVPVVAPSIGAVVTDWVGWRGTFGFTVVVALAVAVWSLRLPETLKPENRLSLKWSAVMKAGRLVVTTRMTVGYTLALTALFGVFVSYIASSELIFSDVYGLGDEFPLIFGGLAIVMGIAAIANGALVQRLGLEWLMRVVLNGYLVFSVALAILSLVTDGSPPFWLFVTALALVISMHSLLIPNMNTAAMIPMGRVAGTASAIIGTVSVALGSLLGLFIDRAYDGGVTPLSVSFLILGAIAWGLARWASAGFRTLTAEPAPVSAE